MGDAPAPEQFSVDGAMLPDGQSGTDEASLQAGERAASAMGDVYVLTIPASKAVDETAAQVLTTAQALEDCLTGYAVSEQTELLAQYPRHLFRRRRPDRRRRSQRGHAHSGGYRHRGKRIRAGHPAAAAG